MLTTALLLPALVGLALGFWGHQRWPRHDPGLIGVAGAAVTLVLVLAGGLWWQGRQLDAAARQARADALVRDSLEATVDTVRVHELRTARGLRRVAERRAVQSELALDSVEELLGATEAKLRSQVRATVADLDTTAGAGVATDPATPGFRYAEWLGLRRPPYTVDATVSMAPDTAFLQLGVRLDSADLTFRFSCEDADPVRRARVSVEAPGWLNVGELDGEADPDVCNPVIPPPTFLDRLEIAAPYAGAALLVGLVTGIRFGG